MFPLQVWYPLEASSIFVFDALCYFMPMPISIKFTLSGPIFDTEVNRWECTNMVEFEDILIVIG